MLNQLYAAWRARHVLLVGDTHPQNRWMQLFLEELGAKPARIAPGADAQTLCRAMTQGRISAVLVPRAHALADPCDLSAQLRALCILLSEAREAGVPLVQLCSQAAVYRRVPFSAREEESIGGETREGLFQSILQLYADGVSRGLLGDTVRVQIVRHMPCLGSGDPAVTQYSDWCQAILAGACVPVTHPCMQGVFIHPLDVVCGALVLGARALLPHADAQEDALFNLGAGAQSLCAHRSAALRLIRRSGGTRPIQETTPSLYTPPPLLDGARARLLCGIRPLLTADDALSLLLEHTRAAQKGADAQDAVMRTQVRWYMTQLCPSGG